MKLAQFEAGLSAQLARETTRPHPVPNAHTHTHTTPCPAVMALVGELDEDDLVYVKREVEERLGSLGR